MLRLLHACVVLRATSAARGSNPHHLSAPYTLQAKLNIVNVDQEGPEDDKVGIVVRSRAAMIRDGHSTQALKMDAITTEDVDR